MAPKQKRHTPLDDPPSDSEEEDHQRQRHDREEDDDEEEASSDEQEEQQQHQPSRAVQPVSKTPPPKHKPSSSSDTESESATESDSEPDPPAPKLKPVASTKPSNKEQQTPKLKPHSSSAVQAKTASSKRPAENNNNNNNNHLNDTKRAKKKVTDDAAPSDEEDAKKSSRDDSKKLFQRVFSEEDEIAILKGMVEFSSKTRGKDPFKCAEEFHDFMKRSKSLGFDASSNQLKQKIRRLKKKFENNAGRGKNGEGPSFSKPHEKEGFELSKKVWGSGEGNAAAEKSTPMKESGSTKSPAKPKAKPEAKDKPNSELQVALADSKETGKTDEKHETSFGLSSMMRFDKVVGEFGLGEDFVRERVELIEASKREELESRWRKLQDAELELYVKRAELYAEQARLMLQANKSSKS